MDINVNTKRKPPGPPGVWRVGPGLSLVPLLYFAPRGQDIVPPVIATDGVVAFATDDVVAGLVVDGAVRGVNDAGLDAVVAVPTVKGVSTAPTANVVVAGTATQSVVSSVAGKAVVAAVAVDGVVTDRRVGVEVIRFRLVAPEPRVGPGSAVDFVGTRKVHDRVPARLGVDDVGGLGVLPTVDEVR